MERTSLCSAVRWAGCRAMCWVTLHHNAYRMLIKRKEKFNLVFYISLRAFTATSFYMPHLDLWTNYFSKYSHKFRRKMLELWSARNSSIGKRSLSDLRYSKFTEFSLKILWLFRTAAKFADRRILEKEIYKFPYRKLRWRPLHFQWTLFLVHKTHESWRLGL